MSSSPETKTTNIRGDVVDKGTHICSVCKKKRPSDFMLWTDGDPKLCLACYYDL